MTKRASTPRPFALPPLLPLPPGEVARRSRDGEGKKTKALSVSLTAASSPYGGAKKEHDASSLCIFMRYLRYRAAKNPLSLTHRRITLYPLHFLLRCAILNSQHNISVEARRIARDCRRRKLWRIPLRVPKVQERKLESLRPKDRAGIRYFHMWIVGGSFSGVAVLSNFIFLS